MSAKRESGRGARNASGRTALLALAAAPTFLVTALVLLMIAGAFGGVGPFELVLVALVASVLTWLVVRLGLARVRR